MMDSGEEDEFLRPATPPRTSTPRPSRTDLPVTSPGFSPLAILSDEETTLGSGGVGQALPRAGSSQVPGGDGGDDGGEHLGSEDVVENDDATAVNDDDAPATEVNLKQMCLFCAEAIEEEVKEHNSVGAVADNINYVYG